MFGKPRCLSNLNTLLWRLEQNISQFEAEVVILWEGMEDIVRDCGGNVEAFRSSTNVPSQVKYVNMLMHQQIIKEVLGWKS